MMGRMMVVVLGFGSVFLGVVVVWLGPPLPFGHFPRTAGETRY